MIYKETSLLLIQIQLNKRNTKSDLELRQLLATTLESRALGVVLEETSSPFILELVVAVSDFDSIRHDFHHLLISLGFNSYLLQDISSSNE